LVTASQATRRNVPSEYVTSYVVIAILFSGLGTWFGMTKLGVWYALYKLGQAETRDRRRRIRS